MQIIYPAIKGLGLKSPGLANPSTGTALPRCSCPSLSTARSTFINSLHFGLETAASECAGVVSSFTLMLDLK